MNICTDKNRSRCDIVNICTDKNGSRWDIMNICTDKNSSRWDIVNICTDTNCREDEAGTTARAAATRSSRDRHRNNGGLYGYGEQPLLA